MQYPFNGGDIGKLLDIVKAEIVKEKPLVEMPLPCIVVGDLFGQVRNRDVWRAERVAVTQFADLLNVFKLFEDPERPGFVTQKFVFLGNYVDRCEQSAFFVPFLFFRGEKSLETMMLLFILKLRFPASVREIE